jgi:hypothetical protein
MNFTAYFTTFLYISTIIIRWIWFPDYIPTTTTARIIDIFAGLIVLGFWTMTLQENKIEKEKRENDPLDMRKYLKK